MSRGKSRFHPRMVPEIRDGYFWLVKDQTGFGTTSFRIPEGNKHPDFDMVQTTVASQYTLLTENGGLQARMRKTTDLNPSFLATAGSVTAGWTGATYFGGWFRLPDASGDITGSDALLIHDGAAGIRRFRCITSTTISDRISGSLSVDGTIQTNTRWESPLGGGAYAWVEQVFDPLNELGGSTVKDRIKLFKNMALLARTTTEADQPSSINDSNTPIIIGCLTGAFANADTTDWSSVYYGNGIPSLKNRKRLANYLNPSNVKFQI